MRAETQSVGKAERTRARILAVAKASFAENGYGGTRTADIARRAGVAEGTVFLHFETKLGLLAAAMAEFYAELIADAEAIRSRGGPGLDALRALLADYVARIEREWPLVRDFARFGRFGGDAFAVAFAAHNRAYTGLYRRLFEDLRETGRLRPELSPELYRDMLFGTIEHYAIARFERAGPHDVHGLVSGLMDLFLNGAGAAPDDLGAVHQKLDTLIGLARRP